MRSLMPCRVWAGINSFQGRILKTTFAARLHTAMILVVACLVIAPSLSSAVPLTSASREAASVVVQNWMHYSRDMHWTLSGTADDVTPVLQDILYDGRLVGYVSAQGNGYVIVPAYQDLPPVTAYSTESMFYVNDEGGFTELVKKDLANKICAAESALNATRISPDMDPVREQVENDHRLWQSYSATYEVFRRAADAETGAHALADIQDVGPLCQTVWHQSAPYNNYCPMGGGGRCAVGCVATAMSQILAYWRSAASGTGFHSYLWAGDRSCGTPTPGATLSATFSDPFDWANAMNVVTTSSPQAQQNAVAMISYEAGVAVNMAYGHCGSGAYVPGPVMIAFQSYFGMAGGENTVVRGSNNAAAWFALLRQELVARRPLFYTFYSHAVVCDGCRASGGTQLHFNFGWAEGHTTWYTVDDLNDSESELTPRVEQAIRGIMPNGTLTPLAGSIAVGSPGGGDTVVTSLNPFYPASVRPNYAVTFRSR
jgi:hypothetical protein